MSKNAALSVVVGLAGDGLGNTVAVPSVVMVLVVTQVGIGLLVIGLRLLACVTFSCSLDARMWECSASVAMTGAAADVARRVVAASCSCGFAFSSAFSSVGT